MVARRKVTADKRSTSRFLVRVQPGAKPGQPAGFIKPSLPTPKDKPPAGTAWVHEIRFAGERLQARIAEGRAALFTSDGKDATDKFARIAAAVRALPVNEIILDGIAIVQDGSGASDPNALAADIAKGRKDRLIYYAFDLLHLDGFDIRAAPLAERKRVLAALLAEAGSTAIAYSEHLDIDGGEMLARVREMGLGGIVSKRSNAPYRSGKSANWVEVRTARRAAAKKPGAPKPRGERRPLLIIDGDSFAHRAYHALPKSIRRAGNKGGGAIVGFANYLMRFYDSEKPRAVVVGWDTLEKPTWRHEELTEYQGGREFDDELLDQLDALPEFVAACGFANAKGAGYEADDFLAAAVAAEERAGGTAIVASGDRDAFQLASASTTILHPMKGGVMARIGPAEVRERYGVEPEQVPDFIAIRGDPSDKIPGAKGVGAVGAASLLRQFPSLEAALAAGRFAGQAKNLRLYKKIATMDTKAPLPKLKDQAPDWAGGLALALRWELNAMAERLRKFAEANA